MNNRELAHFVLTQALRKRGIIRYPFDEEVDDFMAYVDSHPEVKIRETQILEINARIVELERQKRELQQKEDELIKQLKKVTIVDET